MATEINIHKAEGLRPTLHIGDVFTWGDAVRSYVWAGSCAVALGTGASQPELTHTKVKELKKRDDFRIAKSVDVHL